MRKQRTYINRNYFNETNGELAYKKYAISPCPNLTNLGASACYLALASCGALIRYVTHVEQCSFISSTLRIRLRPNDHTMFLDIETLNGLEIVSNARTSVGLQSEKEKSSLLNVIDYTVTRAGKRYLRRVLLEPSTVVETITMRQEAVHVFANSELSYNAIVIALKLFPDLERTLAGLMTRETLHLRNIANQSNNSGLNYEPSTGDDVIDGGTQNDEDVGTYNSKGRDIHTSNKSGIQDGTIDSDITHSQRRANSPPSDSIIQNMLNIKASLSIIPRLLQVLHGKSSLLLNVIARSLRSPQFETLAQKISLIIEEEAVPSKEAEAIRMQGALAVKKGRNGK